MHKLRFSVTSREKGNRKVKMKMLVLVIEELLLVEFPLQNVMINICILIFLPSFNFPCRCLHLKSFPHRMNCDYDENGCNCNYKLSRLKRIYKFV